MLGDLATVRRGETEAAAAQRDDAVAHLVDRAMMTGAEQDQIVQVCGAASTPPVDMVGDQPPALGAAGVAAAAPVPDVKRAPLLGAGVTYPAAQVQGTPVGVAEKHPHRQLAEPTQRRGREQRLSAGAANRRPARRTRRAGLLGLVVLRLGRRRVGLLCPRRPRGKQIGDLGVQHDLETVSALTGRSVGGDEGLGQQEKRIGLGADRGRVGGDLGGQSRLLGGLDRLAVVVEDDAAGQPHGRVDDRGIVSSDTKGVHDRPFGLRAPAEGSP